MLFILVVIIAVMNVRMIQLTLPKKYFAAMDVKPFTKFLMAAIYAITTLSVKTRALPENIT